MKKLYFLFFLVFGLSVYAQNPNDIVYIPDANFKARLLQASPNNPIASNAVGQSIKIDTNNDGQIQISEALNVYRLGVGASNIQSMVGIEAFLNLDTLTCNNNQLTSLDVSQNTALTWINCPHNQLTSLILPHNTVLTYLSCHNNQLTSLDVTQNISLETLECQFNLLTNLDITQNVALTELNCRNNLLTSLDITQNIILISLSCLENQLTSLDVTQNTALRGLGCTHNQLTSLDVSQNADLRSLSCAENQITSIDVSQNPALIVLECYDNQLTSLVLKNGSEQSWNSLHFYSNLLTYVCADEDDLSLVQQRINSYGLSNTCHVNTYCSFTPGGTFYTIQGNNKFDMNNNGCDSNEIDYPNLKIRITNGVNSGNIIANATGNYSIPVQSGTHTLIPQLENPSYFTVSPASTTVSFPATASPATRNFCITANGVKNDLEITVIPVSVARPGFDAEYRVIYKNKGNQVANGSLSFTFNDAVMDLVSANPLNDNSATNSLSWNYTNLNPFETREIDLVFNINSPMETPAVNGGDVLVYTATIVGATDETPNDNTFTLNQTVVNSYDPNDKTCLEGATITPSMVGQYVHYVIRFENTGTYPAENIVVADIIDTTKFDIATLVPQRASHDFFTRINGNKVEFIFENINLPFDDANNDGYVAFKIKTKPTLVLGNTFTNSASIYFDYNFPIVTDPATTTVAALSNQDFDFGTYFTLYPNPAKEILNFETKNEIGVKSVSVYNTLGQIVIAITNVDNLKDIDVSSLTAGSYFVKVYTDKGNAVSKFIKQ